MASLQRSVREDFFVLRENVRHVRRVISRQVHGKALCVCVKHLYRCKTSGLFCCCTYCQGLQRIFVKVKAGGLEPICLSSPTKLWHFGGWSDQPLVPALFTIFVARLSQEPQQQQWFFLHGCLNLVFTAVILFRRHGRGLSREPLQDYLFGIYSFSSTWQRAKPRTLTWLFIGCFGIWFYLRATFSDDLQFIRDFHRRDLL